MSSLGARQQQHNMLARVELAETGRSLRNLGLSLFCRFLERACVRKSLIIHKGVAEFSNIRLNLRSISTCLLCLMICFPRLSSLYSENSNFSNRYSF